MRGVIAGMVLVIWSLVQVSSAAACSCAPQAPAESLREADAALVGRLLAVRPHGRFQADYRYEVGRAYRGGGIEAGEVVTVRSARRAAACALPRRLGKRYGLFLSSRRGTGFGGICGVVSPRRLRRAARNTAGAALSEKEQEPAPACGAVHT
jgi:hypothetical protein